MKKKTTKKLKGKIAKPSSYQKMKANYEQKIQELHKDIYTLISKKNILELSHVKLKYKFMKDIERSIWLGEVKLNKK